MRGVRMLKRASRRRSGVGRSAWPGRVFRRRERNSPAITRMVIAQGTAPLLSRLGLSRARSWSRSLVFHVTQVFGAVLELRQVVQEDQIHFAYRAVALFRDEQLSQAAQVFAVTLVDFF